MWKKMQFEKEIYESSAGVAILGQFVHVNTLWRFLIEKQINTNDVYLI